MALVFKKARLAGLFIALSLFFVSCATRAQKRFEQLGKATESGNYAKAINTVQKKKDLYGKTNRLLWYMDIGILFHYDEKYDSSNIYLEQALQTYDELFTKSITNEAASLITNDNIRPYRSKPYEIILVHMVKALNYQALGDAEAALVETRRAQLLFNEFDRKYKDGEKYHSDGMFHYLSYLNYDAIGETDNAMISLFKAVEAYQKGVVSLPNYVSDNAARMLKINDRESDVELLKIGSAQGKSPLPKIDNGQTEIIFIGNAGKGPVLQEEVWWGTYVRDGLLVVNHTGPDGKNETMSLPAPGLPPKEIEKAQKGKKTLSGTTFHIKFSMPQLQIRPSLTEYFTVNHSSFSKPQKSVVLNNYDKLALQNMEDTKNATLLRTVIRVVLRTISAQKTKGALTTNNPLANLALSIGTDIMADQLEKADTRSCFLIPKTMQMLRIPVEPGLHKIEVKAHSKSGVLSSKTFENIQVKKGQKRFVFLSSIR